MESAEPRRASSAWPLVVGLVVATVLALLIRLPELDTRLIHADESVHCMRYQEVLHGAYRYDPNEYHGPTLYYATLPLMLLRGRTDFGQIGIADYRLVTIGFGVLLIWLMPLAMPKTSRAGQVTAGLLVALSPVLGYYSRYYIQEMVLAAFTVAFLGAFYRTVERRDGRWLIASGVLAGLMVATKETATFSFIAAAVALLAVRRPKPEGEAPTLARRHWLWAVGLFCATAFVLLSGLFHAPSAPFAFLKSLATWGERATGGEMHTQPAIYYLRLLAYAKLRGGFYSEGFILVLALLGALLGWRRCGWTRFVTVYALLITAAYSAIPYKTPWCVVQLVTPYILLAGAGAGALLGSSRWWVKLPTALIIVAGLVHLGLLSQKINHRLLMDRRNPYSHSLTAPDVEDLAATVERVAKVMPQGNKSMVVVIGTDNYYWPIPWYLRRLPNIGWFDHLPTETELGGKLAVAPIVIAAPKYQKELQPTLGKTHESVQTYGLRSRVFFELWVEKTAWAKAVGPVQP